MSTTVDVDTVNDVPLEITEGKKARKWARKEAKEGSETGDWRKVTPTKIIAFLFLLAMAMIWLVPVVWTALQSFRAESEIIREPHRWLPIHWVLENYTSALFSTSTPVMRWLLNSFFISGMHTLLALIVVSLTAYGYTRVNFRGRDTLFAALLATMMFPAVMNLIPLYAIVNTFGWINRPIAAIVPGLGGVFNIFLVRQFMRGIPKEFDESARIDGASEWQIFWRIMLPLIRPVLTVVALFSFTGSWNDFLWPSIVFNDVNNLPLTPGLQLLQGTFQARLGALLAGAIIAIVPTLILYLFTQKYFLESLSLSSGVKG